PIRFSAYREISGMDRIAVARIGSVQDCAGVRQPRPAKSPRPDRRGCTPDISIAGWGIAGEVPIQSSSRRIMPGMQACKTADSLKTREGSSLLRGAIVQN